jgi:branched-chain amino acid aminotransferase
MLDTRGFVAETNATHLFIVERGRVATPTCAACPEGITRAVVLELCAARGIACEARDLSLTEVYRADEVFCTGTMGELVSVAEIDGRTIGSGEAPVAARLQRLFAELTTSEGTLVASP